MFKQLHRTTVVVALILGVVLAYVVGIQARQAAGQKTAAAGQRAQAVDQEYTKRILDATPDKRILTELVDHMPASATVPSPLKFFGYVPGEDSKVTYHKDIVRYYEALDKASARVTMWEIGKTEEGRPMVALAVADEATHRVARSIQADHEAADRPAHADRGAGAAADPDREADLRGDRQHPFVRGRQPGDADRAGVPPGGRGVAVHPADPQQRRSS